VRLLAPREALAARQAAAAAHFAACRTVAGNFDDLVSRFKDLLSGGNLHTKARWMEKARLWRMILLQDPSGFWDATPGLAFALHATSARPGAARGRPVAWEAALRAVRNCVDDGDAWAHSDDEVDAAVADAHTPVSPDGSAAPSTPSTPAPATSDDPLAFSLEGVTASVPRALRAATAAPPGRIWATLLCCALADTLESSWIVNGDASKEMEEDEVTIIDLAEGWLAEMASRDAILAAALPRARAKAARMTREWALQQEERVAALRQHELAGDYHAAAQLQRLAGDVAKALQTRHETFATFLAPPCDGLQRWQKWMLMLTALIGALTVEVWFFQRKGATCCAELRALLGCPGALGSACRGFGGDCADLQSQFAELPPEVLPEGAAELLADWECHAFPDEENPIDSFFVGLIFAATAIPLRYILEVLLGMSNEADHSEAWVTMTRTTRTIARCLGFRPFSWRYADAERRPSLLLRLYARWAIEPFNMAIDIMVDVISAAVLWCAQTCGCGCGCGLRDERQEGIDLPWAGDAEPADALAVKASAEDAPAEHAPAEDAGIDGSEQAAAVTPHNDAQAAADAAAPADDVASAPAAASSRKALPRRRSSSGAVIGSGTTVRMRRPSVLARLRRPSGLSQEVRRRTTRGLSGEGAATSDGDAGDDDVVETAEEIRQAMEAELMDAVKARVMRASGLAGIYISWGIFVWFIFVSAPRACA
jgi:hypothetical protein